MNNSSGSLDHALAICVIVICLPSTAAHLMSTPNGAILSFRWLLSSSVDSWSISGLWRILPMPPTLATVTANLGHVGCVDMGMEDNSRRKNPSEGKLDKCAKHGYLKNFSGAH
ncbi:hypothetical protein BDR03DRAFT_965906 [Suillus americanus]|nr:hypothetical protein BDR03DRAFT_965906 [Suillus americanus]